LIEVIGTDVIQLGDATLENGIRILEYVKDHPGCYLRQIKNHFSLSMGTIQYHINYLTNTKKLTSIRRGLKKFYFVDGVICSINGYNILQILSQDTAREILLLIIEKQNPTQSDLIRQTGMSGAGVNWHLKRLLEFKLISESRSGKYKRYRLATDSKTIIEIIKNYSPGIWDRWNGRLTDVLLFLSEGITHDNT